jgi:hypothetical protein
MERKKTNEIGFHYKRIIRCEDKFSFGKDIVINPMTLKYQIFKFIIVLASIYSSLIYAVSAAFRVDLDFYSYDEYLSESPDAIINPITPSQV